MKSPMTYEGSGVDYSAMDPFKRMAQQSAATTGKNLRRKGYQEVVESRGESAYLIDMGDFFLAHVEEGLGTKNRVAEAMYKLTGLMYFGEIAQDTVAMAINDMITLGAMPLSVAMHLAVGSSDWFQNEERAVDLIEGWRNACNLSRCAWGGGETPTLKNIISPETFVISASATGEIKPKKNYIHPGKLQHGDAILLLDSSGIHANGLTLAQEIAAKLPDTYLTPISDKDDRNYGEALLEPTHIYVGFIEACLKAGIDIHYTANITGHGWRKLMRAPQPFAYVIDKLPPQLPIFDFIQKHGPVTDEEAYGNLNMGAGFAIYVAEKDVSKVLDVLRHGIYPFGITEAGHVEASPEKKVVIVSKGLEYAGSTLAVR
jgi:phosphoribosylformylglycinamidine cyclo-ligase